MKQQTVASKLRKKYFGKKSMYQLYLLALIPLTFIIIFHYIPLSGVALAFKDFSARKGIWGSPWAGLKYFKQIFTIPVLSDILKNTVSLSVLSLVLGFPLPIILAMAFNEIGNLRLKKTLQTISFAPHFLSVTVVVSIINQIFSYRYGIVNTVIKLFGGEAINFWANEGFFRPAYVLSGVWQGAGYGSILYIAALSAVDTSLHEAAALDGASRFQRMIYVNLPCIAPTIIINLILSAGGILGVGYEKVFLMQNNVNYRVSEVISTYVYKLGIQQVQYSFSTAVGLLNALANCIILISVNMIARKVSDTSLF